MLNSNPRKELVGFGFTNTDILLPVVRIKCPTNDPNLIYYVHLGTLITVRVSTMEQFLSVPIPER